MEYLLEYNATIMNSVKSANYSFFPLEKKKLNRKKSEGCFEIHKPLKSIKKV